MKPRILIVDDEPDLCGMLAFSLGDDYQIDLAADPREARARLHERAPELLLLDWMMPGVSGIDFLRELRRDERYQELPVIMLTARGEEYDRIRGLDSGADDYLPKPFSIDELKARIRALLRRARGGDETKILCEGPLCLDPARHRVHCGECLVEIGPTEFRLLRFFLAHKQRVWSREQLLDRVWGGNIYIEERTVDVHILRLRKVLKPFGLDHLVHTVRGAGYRFGIDD